MPCAARQRRGEVRTPRAKNKRIKTADKAESERLGRDRARLISFSPKERALARANLLSGGPLARGVGRVRPIAGIEDREWRGRIEGRKGIASGSPIAGASTLARSGPCAPAGVKGDGRAGMGKRAFALAKAQFGAGELGDRSGDGAVAWRFSA